MSTRPRPAERLRKVGFKVAAADRGKRLDQFLAEQLPAALKLPVSKAKARKLIVAGAVYLNGARVRIASKTLLLGARVEAYVDPQKLFAEGSPAERAFTLTPERVLYEDEHLIVVDKPAGVPTQPTLDEARENLFGAVKKFLAQRDGRVDPYVGLHHRLDRDTSGVILFTKSKEANPGVAKLFAEHGVVKVYQALCEKAADRTLRATWTVRNHLGRLPGPGKRARFGAVRSGGDAAETDFRLLEAYARAAWIEARPKTGRTHQIRVHLAEGDLPIVGDPHYGAREGGASRVMLHAASLSFRHPISGVEMRVESPLPADFVACRGRFR